MTFDPSTDFSSFLHQVQLCRGTVVFQSDEDDVLNLKSTLSQFVFATIVNNPDLIENGRVICGDKSDYDKLKKYLKSTDL